MTDTSGGRPGVFHLLYPNFWESIGDDECGRALFACEGVNRYEPLVKVHTVEGDAWAAVQHLHPRPADFMAHLLRLKLEPSGMITASPPFFAGLSCLTAEKKLPCRGGLDRARGRGVVLRLAGFSYQRCAGTGHLCTRGSTARRTCPLWQTGRFRPCRSCLR